MVFLSSSCFLMCSLRILPEWTLVPAGLYTGLKQSICLRAVLSTRFSMTHKVPTWGRGCCRPRSRSSAFLQARKRWPKHRDRDFPRKPIHLQSFFNAWHGGLRCMVSAGILLSRAKQAAATCSSFSPCSICNVHLQWSFPPHYLTLWLSHCLTSEK